MIRQQNVGVDGPEERDQPRRVGEMGLQDYLQAARRRWWIIALAGVALLGLRALSERGRVPLYTSSVLIQKKEKVSPLEAFAPDNTRFTGDLSSEFEILRSRVLTEAVIDSMHLQLAFDGVSYLDRLAAFSAVEVARGAPQAEYVLRPGARGIEARRAGEDRVLAVAASGQTLALPGVRLTVADAGRIRHELHVHVLSFQDALQNMQRQLGAEQVGNTNMLRVRYTSPDADLSAAVANTVAAVYKAQADADARREATRRREFLARQLGQVADSLAVAQHGLSDYQERARILDPKLEGETLSKELTSADAEVRKLRFQEGVLQSLVTSLQNGNGTDAAQERILALSQDLIPAGADMYKRLQQLESERSRLTASRYGYTDRGPGVEVADSLIRATRDQMRAMAEESLALTRARLSSAETQEAQVQAQVGGLPARATTFARFEQRADAVQKTFDLLADKYYEAQIAEAVASGDISIIDPAQPALLPDPLHTRRNLVLALLAGLLAGFGIAVVLERSDTAIRQRGEAERATGLTALGFVPDIREGVRGTQDTDERVKEAFRSIRAALRFVRVQQPRMIALTSQGPGEGKSFCCAHLAATLAEQRANVLLVDFDLRRPTQHMRFGLPVVPGVSDVLVGQCSVEEAVREVAPGLSLLPAGTYSPDPAGLVGSDRLQELLAQVRDLFDIVVVDTPPVLAVSDALTIGAHCEGVIMVARPFATSRFALSDATAELRRGSIELLGIILNRVPLSGAAGGTYYRYRGYAEYYNGSRNGHGNGNGKKQRRFQARPLAEFFARWEG